MRLQIEQGIGVLTGNTEITIPTGQSQGQFTDLRYSRADCLQLRVVAISGMSLEPAVSPSIPVSVASPGEPAVLQFVQQPSNADIDESLGTITVRVLDANNNFLPTAVTSITLSLGANPGGAVLSGDVT